MILHNLRSSSTHLLKFTGLIIPKVHLLVLYFYTIFYIDISVFYFILHTPLLGYLILRTLKQLTFATTSQKVVQLFCRTMPTRVHERLFLRFCFTPLRRFMSTSESFNDEQCLFILYQRGNRWWILSETCVPGKQWQLRNFSSF